MSDNNEIKIDKARHLEHLRAEERSAEREYANAYDTAERLEREAVEAIAVSQAVNALDIDATRVQVNQAIYASIRDVRHRHAQEAGDRRNASRVEADAAESRRCAFERTIEL